MSTKIREIGQDALYMVANMDLFLEKTMFGLSPWSDSDKEIVKLWSYGEVVRVTTHRERNPKHHKKLFSLLKATVYHLPETSQIKSPEMLLDALKAEMGYVEIYLTLQGEIQTKLKSISFGAMSQDRFNQFYSESLDIICSKLLIGISKEDFERDILNFL